MLLEVALRAARVSALAWRLSRLNAVADLEAQLAVAYAVRWLTGRGVDRMLRAGRGVNSEKGHDTRT